MSISTYPFRWSATSREDALVSLNSLKNIFDAEFTRVTTPSEREDLTGFVWGTSTTQVPAENRGAALSLIYKVEDAFSETHPIYLSVRAGIVNASYNYMILTINVGTGVGTDGKLTGTFYTTELQDYGVGGGTVSTGWMHSQMFAPCSSSNTPKKDSEVLVHKSEAGFVLIQSPSKFDGETSPFTFGIERATSTDGTYRPDGLIILTKFRNLENISSYGPRCLQTFYSVSSSLRQGIPAVRACNYTTLNYHEGGVPVMLTNNVSGQTVTPSVSQSSGAVGPVYPWTFTAPGLVPWRSKLFVSVPVGDYPGGNFESILFGQSLMYRPIDPAMNRPTWDAGTNVGHGYYGVAMPTFSGDSVDNSIYLSGSGCLAVLIGPATKKDSTE